MTSITTTTTATATLDVSLWRDYEPAVLGERGIPLGSASISPTADAAAAAADLFDGGARRVALSGTVDLSASGDGAALRALVLIRELTGYGIVVHWRLRPAGDDGWRLLSHLYPPTRIVGDPGIQREWRRGYHYFKCVYRRGPGFLQIRDRRSGRLRKLTIADPSVREAVELLQDGVPARDVPPEILGDLTAAGLVGLVAGSAWWLPYRVRRWPLGPDIV